MLCEFDVTDLRLNFFGGGQEKMRAFFNIIDKDKAIACYKRFAHGSSSLFPGARLIVFLVKKGKRVIAKSNRGGVCQVWRHIS